jgi:hypothetical protein
VDYIIKATNIKNLTKGCIYAGTNEADRPIVVTLFLAEPTINEVNEKAMY